MQKIYVGPAGNATLAKEPGTEGSLKWLKENGLNAQEIEFVRNIYLTPERAEAIGKLAKQLGIRLSVHAPYFINLASNNKKIVETSKRLIFETADRAERLNADAIAIHAAYYTKEKDGKEATRQMVKEALLDILEKMKANGIKNVKLGIETMAKPNQFGSLDEIIDLCKELKTKQVIPYIDFAHLFCRHFHEQGGINYAEIFEKLKVLRLKHINSHFEGIKWNPKTKSFVDVHTMIDKNPDFLPLAKEILKRKVDITIIAESKPYPDKDALKLKQIFEKLGYKLSQYKTADGK